MRDHVSEPIGARASRNNNAKHAAKVAGVAGSHFECVFRRLYRSYTMNTECGSFTILLPVGLRIDQSHTASDSQNHSIRIIRRCQTLHRSEGRKNGIPAIVASTAEFCTTCVSGHTLQSTTAVDVLNATATLAPRTVVGFGHWPCHGNQHPCTDNGHETPRRAPRGTSKAQAKHILAYAPYTNSVTATHQYTTSYTSPPSWSSPPGATTLFTLYSIPFHQYDTLKTCRAATSPPKHPRVSECCPRRPARMRPPHHRAPTVVSSHTSSRGAETETPSPQLMSRPTNPSLATDRPRNTST
ncbi:hypothetical protein BDZ89DRAFT_792529 [Hymenopellis radicata]|nr:hypothetical protein BDZ89DRAFT_792529 [Hymenopellis radicata]